LQLRRSVTATTPAVEVRGLTKVYMPSPRWLRFFLRTQIHAPVTALDDVTVEVDRGQICAVAGPNGAGKTTLFKILTGLLAPSAGSAVVLGVDATRESPELRRVVGFMSGDDRSLWLRLSCAQNLEFRGRLQGLRGDALRRRIADVLDLVGLAGMHDRIGFALSSGMRARLQFACALLHEPPVLILDEPTATVDPVGSFELLQKIREVTEERGLAVLFSTHRVDEIEALGENVVLLHHGNVVHAGPLDRLRDTLERQVVTFTFATANAADAACARFEVADGTEIAERNETSVTLATNARMGELLQTLAELAPLVDSISEERVPLREVLATVLAERDSEREVYA
jgi:ABC-2 type transport system ATP-binding protein